MMPMMFGERRRLYGVYHPAAGGAGRGVVLCNPYGQEAYRAHRAYRILADALARERVHVLRFDYSGTGDSSGEEMEATLERWIEDVGEAVEELRAIARLRTVHLIGLRLGAALAALTAAARSDIGGVVLWEPIARGTDYLGELLPEGAFASGAVAGEPDGLRLPRALALGIEGIDLAALGSRLPNKRMMITSNRQGLSSQLRQRLDSDGANLRVEHIEDPPAWAEENDFGAGPVPAKTIRTVTQWYS